MYGQTNGNISKARVKEFSLLQLANKEPIQATCTGENKLEGVVWKTQNIILLPSLPFARKIGVVEIERAILVAVSQSTHCYFGAACHKEIVSDMHAALWNTFLCKLFCKHNSLTISIILW